MRSNRHRPKSGLSVGSLINSSPLTRKIVALALLLVIGFMVYFIWTAIGGRNVKIYFATKDGMGLQVEQRRINGDQMRGAMEALIAGPTNPQLSSTLPPDVQVLSIRVSNGLCVVNFSEKLVSNHWGGSTGELLTIYSIVNTLTQFPGVSRVQILVEGRKLETLAGHFILEDSIEANKEIIR